MAHFDVARVSGRSDNIHIFADNLLDILLCSELEIIGFLHHPMRQSNGQVFKLIVSVNQLPQATPNPCSFGIFCCKILVESWKILIIFRNQMH